MSQVEVFDFLKIERLAGNHKYWRKYEIHRELIKREIIDVNYGKNNIGRQVNKLFAHDFLEMLQDEKCFFVQSFRIKEKYLYLNDPADVNVWFKE